MRTATSDIRPVFSFPLLMLLGLAATPRARAAEAPATRPAVANPDYAGWAALEKGSWVKVRIEGTLRQADWTMRLAEVAPDAAVLDVTEARREGNAREPWQERIAAMKSKQAVPTESGEAKLMVGAEPIACRWETRRHRDADDGESGDTTWTSPDVPGFVKRVSWLAADKAAGLPPAKTVETVVGFELRPRAAAAAGPATGPASGPAIAAADPNAKLDVAKAVRKAGEGTGPKKFQWTYAFEPKGWRKWEQTSPTEWVEKWETGEESRFRIDRYIADGERTGVVVRRLPDEDLETVVPDAGKGAKLWFRQLPDGNWSTLGELESAE